MLSTSVSFPSQNIRTFLCIAYDVCGCKSLMCCLLITFQKNEIGMDKTVDPSDFLKGLWCQPNLQHIKNSIRQHLEVFSMNLEMLFLVFVLDSVIISLSHRNLVVSTKLVVA